MPLPMSRAPSAYGRPHPRAIAAYGRLLVPEVPSQVIVAYGNSLIPGNPWVIVAEGNSLIPRVPHGVAAYGCVRHVGARHLHTAQGSKGVSLWRCSGFVRQWKLKRKD